MSTSKKIGKKPAAAGEGSDHLLSFGTFSPHQHHLYQNKALSTSSMDSSINLHLPSIGNQQEERMKKVQKRYLMDWVVVVLGSGVYYWLEHGTPFHRMFSLDDATIQFPMTDHEQIPNSLCIALAAVVPAVILAVAPLFTMRRKNRLHLIHMSLLGLATAFIFNGLLTNTLKLWLGRPRPDFLSRCMPAPDTPRHELVTIAVCTNQNAKVLHEGFKSTPSGHSSTSFSGLGFLTLWIAGQLQAFRPGAALYRPLAAFLPMLLAFYIALSRTEDYRHHYIDVIMGGSIGTAWAIFSYRKHFPSLTTPKCYIPNAPIVESSSYVEDLARDEIV